MMKQDTFKALIVDQENDQTRASIREIGLDSLPPGDVLLSVAYSGLNYKDGLAVTGQAKVLRLSRQILQGKIRGRTVVDLRSE